MAKTNTYKITDANSQRIAKRFTVGGKSQTIIFEDKRGNHILTYTTKVKSEQTAIQESKYFEEGMIELLKSEGTDDEEESSRNSEAAEKERLAAEERAQAEAAEKERLAAEERKQAEAAEKERQEAEESAKAEAAEKERLEAEAANKGTNEPKVYALVKTLQDAKAVLISDFGVKVNALAKPANIRNKAAELGVEFPNLPADEA